MIKKKIYYILNLIVKVLKKPKRYYVKIIAKEKGNNFSSQFLHDLFEI
jgi:hypothetical protein